VAEFGVSKGQPMDANATAGGLAAARGVLWAFSRLSPHPLPLNLPWWYIRCGRRAKSIPLARPRWRFALGRNNVRPVCPARAKNDVYFASFRNPVLLTIEKEFIRHEEKASLV
jgi:hypothetical protein